MKKFAHIALCLMIVPSLMQAWTIKVKNDTGYDIKVLAYYVDAGGQALSALTFGITSVTENEKTISKFKKNKAYGLHFLDISETGAKTKIIKANDTKPVKWDIGSGCIRMVKAWIIEEKTMNAQDIKKSDYEDSNLNEKVNELKWKTSPRQTLAELEYQNEWEKALKENRPITFMRYNLLGDKYSWTTKVVHGSENQCASHDFTVRVKKYDDGTKRLKIDMK